ncbi:MAG: hydrogenase iron-sulfur subunit, partial [Clostridia bacterium]|nr:hydrogenase iron-sulfur subunit [Clostridia bacterium]
FAIGQGGDPEPVRGEIEIDDRGSVVFNSQKMTTSRAGVFSCGEMVTGPGSAVQAMANGRLAAQAAAGYLQGVSFDCASLEEVAVLDKLDAKVVEEIVHIERNAIPMISPEERVRHFKQAELGYDIETAICEARRCLTCAAGAQQDEDLCVHCLTCVRVCPYNVPVINEEGKVSVRNEQCQACGLCLSMCPVYAIKFRAPYGEDAVNAIGPAVQKLVDKRNGKPAILAITCSYGAFALPDFVRKEQNNVAVVRYPCVGKLDSVHLLKAIELGIDGVVVVGCRDSERGNCQYKDISYWAEKRVGHACDMLETLGMNRESITYTELPGDEIDKFDQVIAEAAEKLK